MGSKKQKFTLRFAISVAVIIIFFVTVLNVIVCKVVRAKTASLYTQMIEFTAAARSSEIENWINIYKTDLNKYTESDVVKSGDVVQISDWLFSVHKLQNKTWESVAFVDLTGEMHLSTGKMGKNAKIPIIFKLLLQITKNHISVMHLCQIFLMLRFFKLLKLLKMKTTTL